ncbi:MAG: SIS domain-containing protein [Clostridiales bacterium]|jgi:D-sedoheptulose 7-phosphate isomerase|nr:SIS domain-containing protein [Clostridiales bacterium]
MDYYRYTSRYLSETGMIAAAINQHDIVKIIGIMHDLKKKNGRLFILGVGGSAANASHAVNDFRKLAGIEAYAPTDNVSELTARTNDDGWGGVFKAWLDVSRLNEDDTLLILSVGGGSDTTSANIKEAVDFAAAKHAKITGVVSRDGGYAFKKADACALVPVISQERITPHAEGWQSVVCHLIVNAVAEGDEPA